MIPAPVAAALLALALVATAPAVREVHAPPGSSCPQFYALALSAGWAAEEWPELDHIMWRESRCTPEATHRNRNGSVDRGLLQINSVHRGWLADRGVSLDGLLDPATNLQAARWLYESDGWRPWAATN